MIGEFIFLKIIGIIQFLKTISAEMMNMEYL